jgi:folate/biopterin transporter
MIAPASMILPALTVYLLCCTAQFGGVDCFQIHPARTRIKITSPQQRTLPSYKRHNNQRQPLVLAQTDVDDEVKIDSVDATKNNRENEYYGSTNGTINVNVDSKQTTDSDNNTEEISSSSFLKTIFLGIEPTPDILAIATIYFVEGALGLARLAQTFLLKDELKLGPAELSATLGLLSLPWTIKPLYGFLSDGFPIGGYRRRPYLVLAGFVGFMSYMVLALGLGTGAGASSTDDAEMSMTFTITIISLLLSSASIALSDVVADGIVVQKTREAAQRGDDPAIAGGLQSLCWGSAAIGALISAYFSGSLLETMSPRDVFRIASVLPLAVSAMSFLIQEEPVGRQKANNESMQNQNEDQTQIETAPVKEQILALWSALRQPNIYKPVLFLFLWKATPTSDGAMLYFMTNDIGFGPNFLGRARLVTAVSSLLGVWLYNQYLKRVPIKDVLLWTSIASVPLGLTQLLLISHYNRELGIPDGAFVLGDDVVLSILGEMAFLPTLVLAARLCPRGVEAVLFATLMSIYNGASTVGTEVGAALTKFLSVTETDFSNLALLTIICNISSLLPLVFIGWLDGIGDESEEEMEGRALGDRA